MDYLLEFLNTFPLSFASFHTSPSTATLTPLSNRNICTLFPEGTPPTSRDSFPPQLPSQTWYFSIYFENLHQFSFINEKKTSNSRRTRRKKLRVELFFHSYFFFDTPTDPSSASPSFFFFLHRRRTYSKRE